MNVILTIVHIFGLVTMGFSGLMTTCLITSKIADDGATAAFFEGTWITLLLGALMFFPTLRTPKKLSRQAGFLLVATYLVINACDLYYPADDLYAGTQL